MPKWGDDDGEDDLEAIRNRVHSVGRSDKAKAKAESPKSGSQEKKAESHSDVLGRTPVAINVGRRSNLNTVSIPQRKLEGNLKQQFDQVVANFKWYVDQIDAVLPEVLLESLRPTFELSQEYCPVDTGELKSSGYLQITDFRGKARVEMGYAYGGQPSYAIYVHEMPYYHEPPTRSKWLEAAIDEDWAGFTVRLVQNMKLASGVS
jgi:hypothetical protein